MTQRLTAALKSARHLRSDRVLCVSGGAPITRDRVIKAVRAAQRAAGIEPGVDLSTTQRYMHLSPGATEEAIRLLDGRQAGLELLENSGDIILDTLASTRIGVAGGVGAPLSIAAVADMPR